MTVMTRRRRPVRVTLAHECDLVTVGFAALLAPYAHRVQVLPSPGGVPSRDVDLTLHDTLAGVKDLPLAAVRSVVHDGRLVTWTWNARPELVELALGNGVSGVLSKALPAPRLVAALESIHHGRPVVDLGSDRPATGSGAVIVFFVISGFCIHYPFRDGRTVPLKAYYSRRYVRILVPMVAAILIGRPLGLKLTVLSDSIIWSLVCEEVYYLLYPLLLVLRGTRSWWPLIGVAYLASLGVAATNSTATDYPSYGAWLNWLLGLPCWLLGCELAERSFATSPSRRALWLWRLGIWGLSVVCSVLKFHSPITYPWTLNVFAFVVSFWLAGEIAFAKHAPPPVWLERAGKWSYSMYLMHLHGWKLYLLLALPFFGHLLDWLLKTAFVLGVCYAFYRLVERPSHAFARRLGERMLAKSAPAVPVGGQ